MIISKKYMYEYVTAELHDPATLLYSMISLEIPGNLDEKDSSFGHGHVWGAPSDPS